MRALHVMRVAAAGRASGSRQPGATDVCAGLTPLEPIHFPGRRLMTGIWRGERELATTTAARPEARTVAHQGAPR